MKRIIFYFSLSFIFLSCDDNSHKEKKTNVKWSTEKSIAVNSSYAKEEDMRIRVFLDMRKDWKMKKTGTGLRYWIYEDKEGQTTQEGNRVEVKFKIKLLDGTPIYDTGEGEVSTFKMGKSYVESGIMEAMHYLSKGDKAKLILPSHIAHGLLGDFDEVPPLQVLVIDIHVVNILKK